MNSEIICGIKFEPASPKFTFHHLCGNLNDKCVIRLYELLIVGGYECYCHKGQNLIRVTGETKEEAVVAILIKIKEFIQEQNKTLHSEIKTNYNIISEINISLLQ
jgi:hypothetical protein